MGRKSKLPLLNFDGADKTLVNEFFYLDDAIKALGKATKAKTMSKEDRELMGELFAKKDSVLRAIGRSMKK